MNKFHKILADHDDVYSHGVILYSKADDPDHVYADKACTIEVVGDELKDIYLKGCVVATIADGVETGSYSKPNSLEVTPEGTPSLAGGGSGGVSSWNDLTDKPFYDETIPPITFDGNIEGKEVVMFLPFNMWYVKLSDTYAPPEQVFGTVANGGNVDYPNMFSGTIASEDDLIYFDESWGIDKNTYACKIEVGSLFGGTFYAGIMVAKEQELYWSDDIVMDVFGMTAEDLENVRDAMEPYRRVRLTPGMYFMFTRTDALEGDPMQWVTSVSFPENAKRLDEKHLPESVDGVVIRSSTAGSTKKFKLTVNDSGAITATEVTA